MIFRVFADLISEVKTRSNGIKLGPNFTDWCLGKKAIEDSHAKTEGRQPCEDRGRNWNYGAIAKELQRFLEAQKLKEARKDSFLDFSEGAGPY